MAIQTELCGFPTSDGETLHGLLLQPAGQSASDLAVVMVHGVAMNFYTGPLPRVGQALAEQGYHVLSMNTRGHDWVSRAGNLTAFGGAAYETLEESLLDLDAALAWLASRDYLRHVLFGHSLGAIKVLLYQGTRQRPDVVGVISCSAPRQYYAARAIEQADFPERLATAEALVEAGRGDEFLWATTTGTPGLFTARTYVNKYGRHEHNDVRPHAARLPCRLLATAGSAEFQFFPDYAREIADAAGPERGTCQIVEGANHFYRGREAVLIGVVAEWLQPLAPAARL